MSEAQTTVDHLTIREWAEQRQGRPATVADTGDDEPGVLRIDFEPYDDDLKPISWDAFFNKFDKEGLVFLYQDETEDGGTSRFNKLVNKKTAQTSRR